jgi:F420-0:gamma-glutamyl ligase-like protein
MAIAINQNTVESLDIIAYVELPSWLVSKLTGTLKRNRRNDFVAVVGETEKAYKIVYVINSSISYGFVNPTWMVDYVAKSLVKSIRTDVEAYEQEEIEYYKGIALC